MCNYNITINDVLMEEARQTFSSQASIKEWIQQQVERMLKQVVIRKTDEQKKLQPIDISEKIKSLSAVPPTLEDGDYKDDILDILAYKNQ